MDYLDSESLNGLNLYSYCHNNPVIYIDPMGHMPQWLKNIFDVGGYLFSACIALATTGFVVTPVSVVIFAKINNLTNSIYYNYISDGVSDVNPESYTTGYLNRWDRLDYTKHKTKQEKYNYDALIYFSEYNLHMYSWYLTGWAYGKKIPMFSMLAKGSKNAWVNAGNPDSRLVVYIPSLIVGLLGL